MATKPAFGSNIVNFNPNDPKQQELARLGEMWWSANTPGAKDVFAQQAKTLRESVGATYDPKTGKTTFKSTPASSTTTSGTVAPTTTGTTGTSGTAKPKTANVPVQIRQSDGAMKTGYINPADNLTYYDDGTRVSAQTGASAVMKGSTEFKVKGAPVSTGGTGTGTGGATTTATILLPDGKQVEGYVKNGATYYMVNGVETRIPTDAIVTVNGKTYQKTDTGGKLLEGSDLSFAQSGFDASSQINAQVEQINNFQKRLATQREQGILQAERGAEMARGGLQNQMFQNWLSARQAMTERGLTGSGIAQDANTRLQLAGQQQLAELYTNLSNQINAIDANYQLSNQEKEQEKLNIQNAFFQLRDEIFQGKQTAALAAQESQAKITQQNNESRLAWAKVFGFDPENPDLSTLEAQKFAEDKAENLRKYGISLADVTGYMTFTNEKGEVVSVPTLRREIFVDEKQRAVADRIQRNNEHQDKLKANNQQEQAKAYGETVKNVESSLNNLLDFYKGVYDVSLKTYQDLKANPPDDKASTAEVNKYNSDLQQAENAMKTAYSDWMTTGAKYAEYNSNPVAYVEKVQKQGSL